MAPGIGAISVGARVVGGVADDGCYLCATRGRPDVVFDFCFMEDGLYELTTRYIFFTAVGNSSSHPHFAVVSTAFSSIAALAPSSPELSPLFRAKMGLKRSKTTEGTAAAADAGMKKVDSSWVKSSVKKTDLEGLRAQGLLPPADQAAVHVTGKEAPGGNPGGPEDPPQLLPGRTRAPPRTHPGDLRWDPGSPQGTTPLTPSENSGAPDDPPR